MPLLYFRLEIYPVYCLNFSNIWDFLRSGNPQAALLWIEAMRDAVDADCVHALQGFGRSPTEMSVGPRSAAEETKASVTREASRFVSWGIRVGEDIYTTPGFHCRVSFYQLCRMRSVTARSPSESLDMDRLEGGEAIMSRLRAKVYVNVRVRADGPTKVRHPPLTLQWRLCDTTSIGGYT